jgi:hypothetical protein
MFSAKKISDRICGLIYIARFANIIHLNLNRPTKIAVCAPGFRIILPNRLKTWSHDIFVKNIVFLQVPRTQRMLTSLYSVSRTETGL